MRADFVLDYDVVTVEQPQKLYLMARLASGPAPVSQRRRPLNLSLVIDRSGSMGGDKIAYTRQAAQFMVQNLGAADTLSVVLYNEHVETLIAPEKVTHKDVINQRIGTIKAKGTTNLSGGWLEGCKHVAQNLDPLSLNRVILMSDGLANQGVTNTEKLVALAKQKLEQGISTTTMGLGRDFNEDLLMAMADAGGGAFYFIESPEVAPQIFQEELQGLLNLVGQNLVVSVELTEHIKNVAQLNAYPMHSDGKRVSFRLGDVFGEEVKTLILELSIPALHDVGHQQIAVLRFEFDELHEAGSEHRVLEMPIFVNVAPQGQLPASANSEVQKSVLLLKAAQARRQAVEAADQGDYKGASQVLRRAAEAIEQSNIDNEELAEESRALVQQAEQMEQGKAHYDDYSRKTMSTQAIYTMKDKHGSTQALRTRELLRQMQAEAPERKEGVAPSFAAWNGQTFPLDRDLMRIGRAPQNEIMIDAKSISRFHCQIKRQGDQLLIEDLDSTNGTFVNGVRVQQPTPLSVGDVALLGHETVIFRQTEA
jgi:Ca-activated chloride channel family protein